ncbi:MAG: hypothetical protein JNM21_03620 [Taibaiella sp.]|nr:hypothetical protein [Taibaiella sp.]
MKPNKNTPIIEWEGNLEDDCSAHFNGLLLRAEKMEHASWWWSVSLTGKYGKEIDSANNYAHKISSGPAARKAAERVAIAYIPPPSSRTSAFNRLEIFLRKLFFNESKTNTTLP